MNKTILLFAGLMLMINSTLSMAIPREEKYPHEVSRKKPLAYSTYKVQSTETIAVLYTTPLNKEDFLTIVREDRDLILRQLSIYSPHFVVSCGSNDSWIAFKEHIFKDQKVNQSTNGIHYFIVQMNNCNHKTAVVNFGHPSMRINATLRGVLAFGLRETLEEIFCKLNTD